jgi:aryl-alcohol dehydrogenase-like predicted oxidoreductase
MEQRQLGVSGLAVSALCLGTDSLGSKIGRDASFELLDFFAGRGGTFLDTANFYASWVPGCRGGESETTIGLWMKQRGNRSRIVLATKLGFDYPGSGGGLRAAEIERECEKSLGRLQTGHIDLYYAHRDDLNTPLEETMEAFDRLIRAGKVRAIGASNLSVWRIAEANTVSRLNGWAGYRAVQQRHTYLRPRHGASFDPQIPVNEDLKAFCRSHGLALIAYSILLGGAYTRPDRPIPPHYAGPDADERLRALSDVSAQTGATRSQVIIAWMRQSDPPVLPIIAGSCIGQLEENIAALQLQLTAEQMRRLDTAGNPDIAASWLR